VIQSAVCGRWFDLVCCRFGDAAGQYVQHDTRSFCWWTNTKPVVCDHNAYEWCFHTGSYRQPEQFSRQGAWLLSATSGLLPMVVMN
jgi:hypothetical protein